MKNKKGFTLVELLAVIVILAIIALIATPIILNVIEDAKKGAAKSSALGYLDAVEKQIAIDQMDSTKSKDWEGTNTFTSVSAVPLSRVQVKGKVPTSVSITISKGQITDYTIEIDGYVANPDSKGNIQVEKADGSEESTPTTVGLENCTAVDVASTTTYTLGDKYSCNVTSSETKEFVIIKNQSNSVKLLMTSNIGTLTYTTEDMLNDFSAALGNSVIDSLTSTWNFEAELPMTDDLFGNNGYCNAGGSGKTQIDLTDYSYIIPAQGEEYLVDEGGACDYIVSMISTGEIYAEDADLNDSIDVRPVIVANKTNS